MPEKLQKVLELILDGCPPNGLLTQTIQNDSLVNVPVTGYPRISVLTKISTVAGKDREVIDRLNVELPINGNESLYTIPWEDVPKSARTTLKTHIKAYATEYPGMCTYSRCDQ